MKSKVIISLLLCLFIFQGMGISQTKRQTRETKKTDEYPNIGVGIKKPALDSLIVLKGSGFYAPNSTWSRAQDSYFEMLDNSSKSSLSFRKEFIERKTINRSYDMEFTKDHKSMSIKINAQAREGIVQIVIIKPNGKNFKVLEVEDMESLGWNHTLNAYTEVNKKEYEGLWQVKVSVKDAKGYYDIKLSLK